MAASDAQFRFVFGFVGMITLVVLVVGDRCYDCTTERNSGPPQCIKMENFAVDCVRGMDPDPIYDINDPDKCPLGKHRYVYTEFAKGTWPVTLSVQLDCPGDCPGDGMGDTDLPESLSVCVSEETLIREFQQMVDSWSGNVPELVNGTVCYCQTSPCTADGMIPGDGSSDQDLCSDGVTTKRISYTVIIINVIFGIVVGCNLV
ncbi:uncharacterized protein [Amphiura filiformis]|uniref:uncharacterized protein isoform X2 n=1 Tax=Amphiura filiformis TaxID=82378 RepID=UPI003B2200AF